MSGVPQIIFKREAMTDGGALTRVRSDRDLVWMVDWRKYGLAHCSVYIIAPEGHWPCKVGISTFAKKRVQSLQTSHWKMLAVSRCWWASGVKEARAVEAKTHEMLKADNCYLLGEWFDKTPDKAAEVVEFAAMSVGVDLCDMITQPEIEKEISAEMAQLRYSVEVCPEQHRVTNGDVRLPFGEGDEGGLTERGICGIFARKSLDTGEICAGRP